jgi:hypothetical protein
MRFLSRSHRIKTVISLLTIGVGFIFVVGASAGKPAGILGDVTVQNDASNPVPVTIESTVSTKQFFQISHLVGGGNQEMTATETVPQDSLLLTVDMENSFMDAPNYSPYCDVAATKNDVAAMNSAKVIERRFTDDNTQVGASANAANLSLAPGVFFAAGDELTTTVSELGCQVYVRYFFHTLP